MYTAALSPDTRRTSTPSISIGTGGDKPPRHPLYTHAQMPYKISHVPIGLSYQRQSPQPRVQSHKFSKSLSFLFDPLE